MEILPLGGGPADDNLRRARSSAIRVVSVVP
jgi:hypothetical protein